MFANFDLLEKLYSENGATGLHAQTIDDLIAGCLAAANTTSPEASGNARVAAGAEAEVEILDGEEKGGKIKRKMKT